MVKKSISIILIACLLVGYQIPRSSALTAGELLKSYGVVAGDQFGNLNEGMKLTRAEMAVIMASLNGKLVEAKNFRLKTSFTDIPVNAWYAPYVAYAEAMNWTKGIGNGQYGPMLNVTNKEAAAFLLNTLGKKYSYDRVIETAKSAGVSNGLSNEGEILRGNLFKAMLDTLNAIPEGKTESLGIVLGYLKPVTVRAKVKSLEIVSSKAFNINFENSVSDPSKISISIKKAGSDVSVFSSWNGTKNTVQLASDTTLALGTYDITVVENNSEIYSGSLVLDTRRVARIEVTSSDIQVTNVGTSQLGFASYTVYDQYGENITKDSKASGLVFNVGQFQGSGTDGIITIKPPTGDITMFTKDTLDLTIIDSKTSVTTKKTLPLTQIISSLSDFSINSSGITLQNGSTTPIYIGYKAVDVFGNSTENYDLINAGLMDFNFTGPTDTTTDLVVGTNPAGLKIEIVRSSEDQNKAKIKVTPGNMALAEDTYINLVASTKSGKIATIQIKVLK